MSDDPQDETTTTVTQAGHEEPDRDDPGEQDQQEQDQKQDQEQDRPTTDYRQVRAEPVQRDPKQTLSGHEIEAEQLADWRLMFSTLQARFRTGDFATGLRLVQQIGEAAEEMDHHPDLDLRYPTLHVRLSSHDVGGLTQRDVDLARRITDLAGSAGVEADTAAVQVLELALDTADTAGIRPFWAALLAMDAPEGMPDELNDPSGILPTLWFQETDHHETPRQRFHLDVRVPPEVAERRVRAAVEAGGTLVSDDRAPTFWVLADPEGNRACVTTWVGRAASPDELPDPEDQE